jgi:hypothetical protein
MNPLSHQSVNILISSEYTFLILYFRLAMFQFTIKLGHFQSFRHLLGLTGRGIGLPQGFYLHRTTKNRENVGMCGIQNTNPAVQMVEESTLHRA